MKKGYALFDLDQTLVPWDTQLLFCNFVLKKEPLRRLHVLLLLPFLPLTKVLGAGGMKRVFLNYLAGIDAVTLDEYAQEFVDQIYPSEMYMEMVKEVDRHKQEGRLTILNSASPEIWVKYLSEKMGFDHLYGTRVEVGKRVRFFPDIEGENNKGAVKIGRMRRHFPQDWQEGEVLENSFGYSDSHADLPMLHICENNIMVHPTEKLKAVGDNSGWKLEKPDRPTKKRFQFAISCAKQALGCYKIRM